jgi:hypothetical protein
MTLSIRLTPKAAYGEPGPNLVWIGGRDDVTVVLDLMRRMSDRVGQLVDIGGLQNVEMQGPARSSSDQANTEPT